MLVGCGTRAATGGIEARRPWAGRCWWHLEDQTKVAVRELEAQEVFRRAHCRCTETRTVVWVAQLWLVRRWCHRRGSQSLWAFEPLLQFLGLVPKNLLAIVIARGPTILSRRCWARVPV